MQSETNWNYNTGFAWVCQQELGSVDKYSLNESLKALSCLPQNWYTGNRTAAVISKPQCPNKIYFMGWLTLVIKTEGKIKQQVVGTQEICTINLK